MFALLRALTARSRAVRRNWIRQEVDLLVEEQYTAQWWQAVMHMEFLKDEAAELEELALEAQFAEDWNQFAKVQANQQQVAASMRELLPSYTLAAIELAKRDYALPA